MDLSLSTRTVGDRTVVEVGGEIDVYTAPKLREQLVELVNDGNFHLVVDMEGVDFLDSTGLGVLVGGLKRVRAHEGSLRLVCNQERILKIFASPASPRCSPFTPRSRKRWRPPTDSVPGP